MHGQLSAQCKSQIAYQLDLPSFKDWISIDTSSGVDVEIKNYCKLGLDK